ncbi:Calcineurin-like phosphoesterase [Cyclobacterium lianum]|uniref:Calcineurin-like phosphoesterase n=1 Tax=Cyclobacterium lianum TaxID=388280 RepID=A0A1M7QU32_9BACT|nr:metallophosphoesterase [Cyclobacterium lianum]SHN35119.1 Calcineurin-like phosphoesterase [Cyclobacterium lianum]
MILKYRITLMVLLFYSLGLRAQSTFSFVQMCDTQLGMGGYAHDVKTFRQAVKQINALDADFVVICGDLVHNASDSSYADFKSIREGFTLPSYLVSGNHDVGNVPNDTSLQYYRKTIGKDYYRFRHKKHAFVVTNTQLWKVRVGNESEKHDQWLKKTIKRQKNDRYPTFVLGHYPLYTEDPEEADHYYNLPDTTRKQLLELFVENNVAAYLSGHTHKLTVNQYRQLQLVSGETTSKNFDERPMGFRLWQVSADTVRHQFVPLEMQAISP